MIPITLEFVAFGPFLKKQTIDFKKFENDKIFLISGQTGSGKTTIFDAITFSLFGEASGCVRQTDSFKSQFADAKDLCYVEFEFCIHNKIYKVYREPIQFKLKRTGNLVRTNSTAILTLDDGQIISGKEPVDKYIEQLLGINSEQFKKIVMLPQGEFKKFLLDDNVEKQKILRTIFNTKILNDFTEKLRENMNIYKIQHDEILTEQSAYMKSIKCEEGDELFLELDSSQKDVSHIQKLLHENIKNSQEKLNIQKEKINQLTQEIKEINLPLYTQINQKFLQLEQTKKELNELKNKKTTIDVYQEKLDFLKKIRDILPIFNLKNVTSTQLDEQNENLLEYKKSLENAKINLDNEKKFNQECKNQQKFEPEIILKIENISVQHKILDDIEANNFALKTTILDTEKMKNNQNSYNVYIDYLKICEEIIALENEICLANEAIKNDDLYEKLVVEFLEKQKNYEKVFHDFLNCQSANLAQKLKIDEPCPVCGSTFHPKLAIFSSEAVTQNQVEKEKNIYEKITKEVEKIKTICEQQNKDFLGEQNDKEISINKILILEKQKKLCIELEFLKEKKSKIVLADELKKIFPLPKIDDVLKRVNTISQKIAVNNEKKDNILNNISLLKQKLDDDISDKKMLNEKFKQLSVQLEKIRENLKKSNEKLEKNQSDFARLNEGYALTLTAIEKSNAQLIEYSSQFNLYLSENKIAQNDFFENINQIKNIDNLTNSIAEYQNSIKVKTEIFNSLIEELKDKKTVDISILKEKQNLKQSEFDAINNEFLETSSTVMSNKNLYEKIKIATEKQKKIDKKYLNYSHLFDVANGKFSDRTNFERYVLASYFDEVIECANVKLEQMTASRYILSRRTEREKSGRASGLSLDIFDSYNGGTRRVDSLSGGETFKVALCLALGLSMVISQNSGGIELNTMFIDEGFGSLDPDSIDGAIDCLNELVLDGRYIGIISHVNELKEKIPAKIIVNQTSSGSYIEI